MTVEERVPGETRTYAHHTQQTLDWRYYEAKARKMDAVELFQAHEEVAALVELKRGADTNGLLADELAVYKREQERRKRLRGMRR